MFGAVYLVKITENHNSIFKVGMTACSDGIRVNSYGTNSEVINVIECGNPKSVEDELIKVFNDKFELTKGKEYFSGEERDIKTCFHLNAIKHAEDPKFELPDLEANLDIIRTSSDQTLISSICDKVYNTLGIDESFRIRLGKLSQTIGFEIDATKELKYFNVIASKANSTDIRRGLARAGFLHPKNPIYDKTYIGVIEETPYCKVFRREKTETQIHRYNQYMITFMGLQMLLTKTPTFSTYFAFQTQVLLLQQMKA